MPLYGTIITWEGKKQGNAEGSMAQTPSPLMKRKLLPSKKNEKRLSFKQIKNVWNKTSAKEKMSFHSLAQLTTLKSLQRYGSRASQQSSLRSKTSCSGTSLKVVSSQHLAQLSQNHPKKAFTLCLTSLQRGRKQRQNSLWLASYAVY